MAWYLQRSGRLSITSIDTARRERFYWAAILFTFALGTAAGDLAAEQLHLGYFLSVGVFGAVIAAVAVARFGAGANPVATFWIAYVLTRPRRSATCSPRRGTRVASVSAPGPRACCSSAASWPWWPA